MAMRLMIFVLKLTLTGYGKQRAILILGIMAARTVSLKFIVKPCYNCWM
jgi:hypothetical protein